MGFGFNLFVFPALVLATLILPVVYFRTKKTVFLKALAAFWVVVFGIGILSAFAAKHSRSIRLTKRI
jgi:hypothetical protein